ncbi:MAG: hypothetical protein MZV64_73260 [Ignavibacteriales bacterium]|nr:hypothetical protein [Ignavibacteriales bacterium]
MEDARPHGTRPDRAGRPPSPSPRRRRKPGARQRRQPPSQRRPIRAIALRARRRSSSAR